MCDSRLGLDGVIVTESSNSGKYKRIALKTDVYTFVTYSQANEYCACKFGTELAKVESDSDNSDLFDLTWFNEYGYMWIGLNDIDTEGTYVWTDGSNGDYTNWYSPSQPNNLHNQDCVVVFYNDGKWQDVHCDGGDGFEMKSWACNYN